MSVLIYCDVASCSVQETPSVCPALCMQFICYSVQGKFSKCLSFTTQKEKCLPLITKLFHLYRMS